MLPDEILERIICYEGPKKETFDELLRKREVCRKWDLLIGNNKILWKSFFEHELGRDLFDFEIKSSPIVSLVMNTRSMNRYICFFPAYYEFVLFERFGCMSRYCTNIVPHNVNVKKKKSYCDDCTNLVL